MRDSRLGIETVVIRDNHSRNCWIIKPEVIDGLLARGFQEYLPPGVPLKDEDYPKSNAIKKTTTICWKGDSFNIFPDKPQTPPGQTPPELHSSGVSSLTGGHFLRSPKYNLRGADLLEFALQPRTKLSVTGAQ